MSKQRLIDADALGIGRCNPDIFPNRAYAAGWNGVINLLDDAPTVDAVPVVHGEWINSGIGGAKVCSNCNTHMGLSNFNYCPHCGALMDGDKHE